MSQDMVNIFTKYRSADSGEHWLVMHFLKNVFCIIFNPKKSYGLQL